MSPVPAALCQPGFSCPASPCRADGAWHPGSAEFRCPQRVQAGTVRNGPEAIMAVANPVAMVMPTSCEVCKLPQEMTLLGHSELIAEGPGREGALHSGFPRAARFQLSPGDPSASGKPRQWSATPLLCRTQGHHLTASPELGTGSQHDTPLSCLHGRRLRAQGPPRG